MMSANAPERYLCAIAQMITQPRPITKTWGRFPPKKVVESFEKDITPAIPKSIRPEYITHATMKHSASDWIPAMP